MVVYEVALRVAPEVEGAFRAWLPGHIAGVLASAGFVSAAVFDDDAPDPDGWARLAVQYTVESRAALGRYLDHDAPRLREDGVALFGAQFVAARRVLVLGALYPAPSQTDPLRPGRP